MSVPPLLRRMRDVVFLRHGEAAWAEGMPDRERPLERTGRRNAVRVAKRLRRRGFDPDVIVCSPARRTLETAARAAKAWAVPVAEDEAIYQASGDALADLVRSRPGRVLLVGHHPGLEEAAVHLAGPREGFSSLEPGCAAWLREEDGWEWVDVVVPP